jgi:hypothetical protein
MCGIVSRHKRVVITGITAYCNMCAITELYNLKQKVHIADRSVKCMSLMLNSSLCCEIIQQLLVICCH